MGCGLLFFIKFDTFGELIAIFRCESDVPLVDEMLTGDKTKKERNPKGNFKLIKGSGLL